MECRRTMKAKQDTYRRSAEIEREIGREAYESARGDALGVPMCVECGEKRQHSLTSDRCRKCDN